MVALLLISIGISIRITTRLGVAGMRWVITSRTCFAKLRKTIFLPKKMVCACVLFQ